MAEPAAGRTKTEGAKDKDTKEEDVKVTMRALSFQGPPPDPPAAPRENVSPQETFSERSWNACVALAAQPAARWVFIGVSALMLFAGFAALLCQGKPAVVQNDPVTEDGLDDTDDAADDIAEDPGVEDAAADSMAHGFLAKVESNPEAAEGVNTDFVKSAADAPQGAGVDRGQDEKCPPGYEQVTTHSRRLQGGNMWWYMHAANAACIPRDGGYWYSAAAINNARVEAERQRAKEVRELHLQMEKVFEIDTANMMIQRILGAPSMTEDGIDMKKKLEVAFGLSWFNEQFYPGNLKKTKDVIKAWPGKAVSYDDAQNQERQKLRLLDCLHLGPNMEGSVAGFLHFFLWFKIVSVDHTKVPKGTLYFEQEAREQNVEIHHYRDFQEQLMDLVLAEKDRKVLAEVAKKMMDLDLAEEDRKVLAADAVKVKKDQAVKAVKLYQVYQNLASYLKVDAGLDVQFSKLVGPGQGEGWRLTMGFDRHRFERARDDIAMNHVVLSWLPKANRDIVGLRRREYCLKTLCPSLQLRGEPAAAVTPNIMKELGYKDDSEVKKAIEEDCFPKWISAGSAKEALTAACPAAVKANPQTFRDVDEE